MKTNVNFLRNYDNKFRWGYILETLGFLLAFSCLFVVSLIIPIVLLYVVAGWVPELTIGDLRMLFFESVIVFIVCVLKYFYRFRTGKYSIVGDNLMVCERYFSCETNLTIPISHIMDVQFAPNYVDLRYLPKNGIRLFFTPFRLLEITVGEKKYQIYAYAYAKDLYDELHKRIMENNINQPVGGIKKVFFD